MPLLAENRRGLRARTLLDRWEVGIVLSGPEVKAAKRGSVDLSAAFAFVRNGQLWLINADIAPYPYARGVQQGYNPKRRRKLLATKREITSIASQVEGPGLTLVPVRLYTKQSLVKLEIALARGQKRFDKREAIKKREIDRRIQRATRR